MGDKNRRSSMLKASLLLIQIFNGISGVVVEFMLIRDPTGYRPQAVPRLAIRNPFSNFVIPGIALLVIIGVGNLAGTLFTLMKHKYARRIPTFLGAFMMIWIISEASWIRYRGGLQPL